MYGVVWLRVLLVTVVMGGCGKVANSSAPPVDSSGGGGDDAAMEDASPADGATVEVPPGALGAMDNPATSCGELKAAGSASGVFWLKSSASGSAPFRSYCDQLFNGGGWAMVENSVRRTDGTTTAFWQFKYADRLKQKGTPAPDQNYYDGSLYLLGTEYVDVIVDLQNKSAVVATVTVSGFDPATMKFITPTIVPTTPKTNDSVFEAHFMGGWSAQDYNGGPATSNCAMLYSNVAQHYGVCWAYNLGSDADKDANNSVLDGGVGPHVNNNILTAPEVNLAVQASGGVYSQVNRIARFTRW